MANTRHNKSKRTGATFTDWVLGRSLAAIRTGNGTSCLQNVSTRLSAEANFLQIENNLSTSSKTYLRIDKDNNKIKTKKLVDKDITSKDTNIRVRGTKKSIKVANSTTVSSTPKEIRTVKNINGHNPSKLSQDLEDSSKSQELSREVEEETKEKEKSNLKSSDSEILDSKVEGVLQSSKLESKEAESFQSVHEPLEKDIEKNSWNINYHDHHHISKPGTQCSSDENITKCTTSSVNSDKATRLTNHAAIWGDEMDFITSSSPKSNSNITLKLEPNDIWSEQDCRILEFLESNHDSNKWLYIQAAFYNWTGRMISGELIAHKFYSDGLKQ